MVQREVLSGDLESHAVLGRRVGGQADRDLVGLEPVGAVAEVVVHGKYCPHLVGEGRDPKAAIAEVGAAGGASGVVKAPRMGQDVHRDVAVELRYGVDFLGHSLDADQPEGVCGLGRVVAGLHLDFHDV